jgi:hypothetical protein
MMSSALKSPIGVSCFAVVSMQVVSTQALGLTLQRRMLFGALEKPKFVQEETPKGLEEQTVTPKFLQEQEQDEEDHEEGEPDIKEGEPDKLLSNKVKQETEENKKGEADYYSGRENEEKNEESYTPIKSNFKGQNLVDDLSRLSNWILPEENEKLNSQKMVQRGSRLSKWIGGDENLGELENLANLKNLGDLENPRDTDRDGSAQEDDASDVENVDLSLDNAEKDPEMTFIGDILKDDQDIDEVHSRVQSKNKEDADIKIMQLIGGMRVVKMVKDLVKDGEEKGDNVKEEKNGEKSGERSGEKSGEGKHVGKLQHMENRTENIEDQSMGDKNHMEENKHEGRNIGDKNMGDDDEQVNGVESHSDDSSDDSVKSENVLMKLNRDDDLMVEHADIKNQDQNLADSPEFQRYLLRLCLQKSDLDWRQNLFKDYTRWISW